MEPVAVAVPDAGKALGGISRATIYRLIDQGKLEARKVGTRTVVTTASIKALIADAPAMKA